MTSNQQFWTEKFAGNVERDLRTRDQLHAAGWRVAVVWECALRVSHSEATISQLVEWILSDSDNFETPVVRAAVVSVGS